MLLYTTPSVSGGWFSEVTGKADLILSLRGTETGWYILRECGWGITRRFARGGCPDRNWNTNNKHFGLGWDNRQGTTVGAGNGNENNGNNKLQKMRSRGCIVWVLSHTATRRTRPRFWTYHAGYSAYLCIPYNTQLSTIHRPGFLKVALTPISGGGCGLLGGLPALLIFFWLGCFPDGAVSLESLFSFLQVDFLIEHLMHTQTIFSLSTNDWIVPDGTTNNSFGGWWWVAFHFLGLLYHQPLMQKRNNEQPNNHYWKHISDNSFNICQKIYLPIGDESYEDMDTLIHWYFNFNNSLY